MASHSQQDVHVHHLCIVGAGMIGSAAARHATLISPHIKVCLVGPKEPEERISCRHGIFGAHYDEGRITGSLTSDPIWAELSKKSIERYRELEAKSGVKFFTEVGIMSVMTKEDSQLRKVKENAKDLNVRVQLLERNEVAQKFPFLSINVNTQAVLQTKDAGHVSPRAQVTAQQTAAQQQGCNIIDDVVDQVVQITKADGSQCMKVTTAEGGVIFARRVLLTTGAFTGFRDLLPRGKILDTKLLTQTVVFAEINDTDAERLKGMPSMLPHSINENGDESHCYILPPIKYPDGKYYLKIGHGREYERELTTAAEVADWYKTKGDTHAYQYLLDWLFDLVRGVTPVSIHGDCCVTTHTPTNQVYCDMITPTLGITVGGNGYAAKSADEIGRMAARMIIAGRWDHHLPQERFKAQFKVNKSKRYSKL